MKFTIHTPTGDFAYVESELEGALVVGQGDETRLVEEHNNLVSLVKGRGEGFGLEHKEWNRVLDGYLNTGECDPNDIEGMDKTQQNIINEIKKAFKRIKN
ncbi:MAG: hypothetical protein Q6360_13195 [Candidatus Brocadiales bacterium]|nr:hypothetical protein [Candidatus Brocadiales bacterium]